MLVLTLSIFIGEKQKLKTSEEYDTGVQNEQITDVFLQVCFPLSELSMVLFQTILKHNV